MATVYKLEIEMVSPWTAFDPDTLKKMIEKMLEDAKHFENIEVKVTKLA
jgi:hypothetical protein